MDDFTCGFCESKIYIHADGTAACSCDLYDFDSATTPYDLPDKWDQYQTKREVWEAMVEAQSDTDFNES